MTSAARSPTGRAVLFLVLLLGGASPGRAHTTIVPDDFPTIQAGVDHVQFADAETLLVRPGDYPEIVEVHWEVFLLGAPSAPGAEVRIDGLRACWQGGSPQGSSSMSRGAPSLGGLLAQRYENLRVSGPVVICATNGPVVIGFKNCHLDAGVACNDPLSYPAITEIGLQNCEVVGPATLRAQYLYADSNTFHAPLWLSADWIPSVSDNRFENIPGTAMTVLAHATSIARNVIRGGTVGIYTYADEGDAQLDENRVEGCAGDGIVAYANDGSTFVKGNTVSHCGGVGIRAGSLRVASGNRVTDCAGNGLNLDHEDAPADVVGNVVGRCGQGIVLLQGYVPDYENPLDSILGNTAYACTGAGLLLQNVHAGTVARNIAAVDGKVGLAVVGGNPLMLTCNDWFANGGGATSGVSPGSTDLAVDPLFCDVASDDVQLRSDSPLLDAPGCGLIGALGKGCDPPPVVIELELKQDVLPAAAHGGWVTAWLEPAAPFTAADIDVASVRLNGVPASTVDGRIGDRDRDGRPDLQLRFDREAVGGTLGHGAVVAVTATGSMRGRAFVGTDQVRVPPGQGPNRPFGLDPGSGAPVLAIEAPRIGRVASALRVTFSLADASPARIDLLDVAGREVLSQDVAGAGPGEHAIELAGRDRIAQGIYFLRIRQGPSEARTRAAIVR